MPDTVPDPPPPAGATDAGSETVAQSPDDAAGAAARSREPAGGGAVAVPGYVIERELGRGGMGVVYLARHLALNRAVALKMILSGDHSAVGERLRFLAEAEAIARLRHPNIVQLYEIGTHNDCPFFTLEFCEGGALDAKLGGHPLPPRDAAVLVETLARAMQVAHDAGIVHRDLKPQNVLLAADGSPKVTDFGLAKRVGEGASDLTASGAVLGTPSYMAPEQAAGKHKEVGHLADVYALGAILYAAVTGRPPFRAATAMDTIVQVLNDDPVRPTYLVPATPPDLETICLKCLHKDPARRYASAAALADDLRRFLNGEPILARPVGLPERAWKWARRRPTAAALLATSAVVTLALVAGAAWFTDRLRVERNAALAAERSERLRSLQLVAALADARRERDEKDRARESERALRVEAVENDTDLRIVISTLVHLLRENAARSNGATIDIPALLADVRKFAEPVPGENLRVRVGMLQMVGIMYAACGRAGEAVPIVEQMERACRKLYGDSHRETLTAMTNLGQVYLLAGETEKGLSLLTEAVRLQVKYLGPTDPATLEGKKALARTYGVLRLHRKSFDICDAAVADLRSARGPDAVDVLDFLGLGATAAHHLSLAEREEEYLRELVRVTGLKYGATSEPVADALARYAAALADHGKWDRAEAALRECLSIREGLLGRPGSRGPWVVAATRSVLGGVLTSQKKYAAAEPLLVGGAEELIASHNAIPTEDYGAIQKAIDRVVELYTVTGDAKRAAEWRARTVPPPPRTTMNPPVAP
ncbi:serine threonine protein kinase : WD40 repeat-containing protein OS=Singulisphaera acidiphila (strain ATCC BAA-1392 / DSM 18658 / VKM B-2454 / MOB10) GN=Sinac_7396 PE=3 SV=1: Pkinase: TPR_10: TPR_10: TPR_10: TPR_10 [Gemmataceae bacterium]|nr:serine threonine protein kinase : WD40 repeat-containing protein OS=Singulisphaera acidiphila (strain ATCC BAA-1392 / DSM 18658 / VKM B-2454 / MOB10) GN=Sinac_7396 PE=3 SV=1: Pkinase: TPR_10: TPR_10: TPR_10: TPR_10 [Gemmataceae bacterium]VTT99695.1 serine threonine protein kinase : WD40 repeat-containing protein OS=Singulisphaera acidiphila (strain ATCC BAA-1392 / DSM 18658 / VKM B-2454 / MOB10) GN=Sinac_7396 PE=3 SV=1: Pkinase: TPR_10: TPR_10: TPR_10: TPR_10 [Gemmataceae bacterium]